MNIPGFWTGIFLARAVIVSAGLAGLALATALAPAAAQTFPDRPIRVIVPFPPGGPVDVLARALGEAFRERTGQSFIVENKPGANTGLAAVACKDSAPDGYTICLLASTSVSINPWLYSDLRYTPADLAPVTNIAGSRAVLMLNPDVPAANLAEMSEWSKKNPEKMNYGSFGVGGETHLMMEWLKKKTGLQATHVPFQGFAPALIAFDRGDIQIMVPVTVPPILDRIREGKAKAILILGDAKAETLPGTPAVGDLGLPPLNFNTWFGMLAPAGTPKDRIEKLSAELRAIITQKAFADKFLNNAGLVARPTTPDEFRDFLVKDFIAAGELVKVSGVKL